MNLKFKRTMILGFSTQINGKPTYFVEKIQQCLRHNGIDFEEYLMPSNFDYKKYYKIEPKLHTIRDDKNNRWKPGTMIDFFINCRQSNMFRFAPRLPVVSVQSIQIDYYYYYNPETLMNDLAPIRAVIIDDIRWLKDDEILKLAQNDGFDTVDDFFSYFNEGLNGKIIHWTDLRY